MALKQSSVIVGIAAVILFTLTTGILHWLGNVRGAVSPCVINLQNIQAAKESWMSQSHKAIDDIPTWDDLKEYLEFRGWTNGLPRCPQGGAYTLARVRELPKCSLGGRGHTLDKY